MGWVFLWKIREKGKGAARVGGGVETGRGTGKSMRARVLFVKTFSLSPDFSQKWPRSLFRPVQARSWKKRSGPGWDQDGPGWPPPRDLDGSETL